MTYTEYSVVAIVERSYSAYLLYGTVSVTKHGVEQIIKETERLQCDITYGGSSMQLFLLPDYNSSDSIFIDADFACIHCLFLRYQRSNGLVSWRHNTIQVAGLTLTNTSNSFTTGQQGENMLTYWLCGDNILIHTAERHTNATPDAHK